MNRVMENKRSIVEQGLLTNILIMIFLIFAMSQAEGQTATITAITGSSCAGTRFGSNLNCTSNDFSSSLTFDQPTATALTSCIAGSTVNLDILAATTSNSPIRYDGAYFIGELGNSPSTNDPSKTCSLGVFPVSPSPYVNLDNDVCGDYAATSNSTLLIKNVSVKCTPTPGTNTLSLPYTLVFNNQTGGNTCTAANVTANTTAKCVSSSTTSVTGVVIAGYVKITKQTDPHGTGQAFNFSATTSSSTGVSPASFSLQDGQSTTVQVPFNSSGSSFTVTLTEAAMGGWYPNTSIVCLTPSGGSTSSYVSVDNSARTIVATLNPTNYGAECTVTNTKIPTLKLQKTTLSGFGGPFTFLQTNLTSTPTSITTAVPSTPTPSSPTAIYVSSIGTAVTLTETSASGFFITSGSCTDANSANTTNTGSFGSLSGTTLTIPSGKVVAGADFNCVLTNTKALPQLSITKTPNTSGPVTVGTVITYTYKVKNIGNVAITNVNVSDTHNGSGVFSGPANEVLVTDTAPTGDSTDSVVNGTWDTLGIGDVIQFTATYAVTQSDLDFLQ